MLLIKFCNKSTNLSNIKIPLAKITNEILLAREPF